MNFNNKRKHYSKTDIGTASDKIHVLTDEVETDEKDDTDNLLNNLEYDFVLAKNLEDCIVPDEQSNNVLMMYCRCVLNMAISKQISQSLFVKHFKFSIFYNIFLYTLIVFVFSPQGDFYIVHAHLVAFFLFLL